MNSEWMSVRLADCASFQEGYVNPSQRDESYFGDDVKWLRATDLNNGFVFDTGRKLSRKGFESAGKSALLFEPGTLAISKSGTIGRIGILKDYMCGNRAVINIRVNEDCDTRFIFYVLLINRPVIETLAEGSVQKTLYVSSLGRLQIPLPPIEVQREIASILGVLDDRIELLRETNATLEAIAQALFKSWFVDFDPVHANAGTKASSLPPEIQALFPATFTDSPQGPIPEGWEYVSLKEAVDIFDSKRIPLAGQERAKRKGQYPYYGAAALMDWVDDYIFDGVYLLLGEDGSVADSDGYPITQYVWGKIWVNNHAHVLQGRNGISTEHLMLYLKGVNITPYMTGAVQAKLSQSNMWRIEFLMPTKNISRVFAEFIAPMFEKIRDNSEQADSLAKLRDTLLPRLISGQLRLPEAE